jgi:hypothetical protein
MSENTALAVYMTMLILTLIVAGVSAFAYYKSKGEMGGIVFILAACAAIALGSYLIDAAERALA